MVLLSPCLGGSPGKGEIVSDAYGEAYSLCRGGESLPSDRSCAELSIPSAVTGVTSIVDSWKEDRDETRPRRTKFVPRNEVW